MIRKAQVQDIKQIKNITEACAKHMIAQGIYQWNENYPSLEILTKDIIANNVYLFLREEEIVGTAEVLEVFNSPKFGQVAGCMVVEGSILKSKPVRVLRDDVVIHQGELDSLRRFKDDVGEVKSGTECGVGIKNYKDIRPGDKVEVFDRKEEAQSIS